MVMPTKGCVVSGFYRIENIKYRNFPLSSISGRIATSEEEGVHLEENYWHILVRTFLFTVDLKRMLSELTGAWNWMSLRICSKKAYKMQAKQLTASSIKLKKQVQ